MEWNPTELTWNKQLRSVQITKMAKEVQKRYRTETGVKKSSGNFLETFEMIWGTHHMEQQKRIEKMTRR